MERTTAGWGSGLLGVMIFSGSLPATRLAVTQFTPTFLTSARATVAAMLGGLCLLALRQARPTRSDVFPLGIVAVGVVVGFPLLTGLALQRITASHSIVFIGLLPLATAIFGVLRGGERPKPAFWLFSMIGAGTVSGFALTRSGGGSLIGDVLMIAAILLCGLGYAEGATLSRRLGGWQVISWALLLSLPIMAAIAFVTMPTSWNGIEMPAWISLAYVSPIQHVSWLRLLVSRACAGRDCRCRAVAASTTLLRPDVGGDLSSRNHCLDDVRIDRDRRVVRRRRQAFHLIEGSVAMQRIGQAPSRQVVRPISSGKSVMSDVLEKPRPIAKCAYDRDVKGNMVLPSKNRR